MNIAKLAEGKVFKVIDTPHSKDGQPPICVLCEERIKTPKCFVSRERDGFFLHLTCGKNIEVEEG